MYLDHPYTQSILETRNTDGGGVTSLVNRAKSQDFGVSVATNRRPRPVCRPLRCPKVSSASLHYHPLAGACLLRRSPGCTPSEPNLTKRSGSTGKEPRETASRMYPTTDSFFRGGLRKTVVIAVTSRCWWCQRWYARRLAAEIGAGAGEAAPYEDVHSLAKSNSLEGGTKTMVSGDALGGDDGVGGLCCSLPATTRREFCSGLSSWVFERRCVMLAISSEEASESDEPSESDELVDERSNSSGKPSSIAASCSSSTSSFGLSFERLRCSGSVLRRLVWVGRDSRTISLPPCNDRAESQRKSQ